MQADDFRYTGHTEYLAAELEGEAMMILCSDVLRVGLVTKHIPVSEIAATSPKEGSSRTSTRCAVRSSRISASSSRASPSWPSTPTPATADCWAARSRRSSVRPSSRHSTKGVLAFGPFAADGLFRRRRVRPRNDGILAMYHDQGLAPFKSLSPDGVNFTAGLSAVRTSPDHGTAFDIAGKDKADPQSMRNAIYAAIDIAEHRRAWAEWTRNPLQRAERDRGGR